MKRHLQPEPVRCVQLPHKKETRAPSVFPPSSHLQLQEKEVGTLFVSLMPGDEEEENVKVAPVSMT